MRSQSTCFARPFHCIDNSYRATATIIVALSHITNHLFNEPPSINLTTFNRTIDASASCASPSPLDTTGVRRTSVYGTIGYIMVGSSEKQIPILFKKTRRDAARQYEQEEVRALLTHLAKRLHTNSPINRMEIGIDYPKNPKHPQRNRPQPPQKTGGCPFPPPPSPPKTPPGWAPFFFRRGKAEKS